MITEPAKSSPMNPGGMKNSNEVSVGIGLLVLLEEEDASSENTFAVSIPKRKIPSMFEVRIEIFGRFLSKMSRENITALFSGARLCRTAQRRCL